MPNEFAPLVTFLAWALAAATVVVHLAFSVAVHDDAVGQRRRRAGPVFVGPFIWFLATLLGGAFIAAAYWAIHHSTLRPRPPEPGVIEPRGA